jgi:uncharacterized protein YbjQ (UPF0145 family)
MAGKLIKCLNCPEEYNSLNAVCPSCGIPSSSDETVSETAKKIKLSTTNEVSGRQILDYLGLVFGAGNAAWTVETTSGRANTALAKAEDQIRMQAVRLGADAVVGVTFSMDSSGSALNRSQAITLLGTAVKLK